MSDGERFCQQCGKTAKIKQTVPWQPDICLACGTDIEAE